MLWMSMEVEFEGLEMVGEVGENVSKGVGSGDCERVESCGVGVVVEVGGVVCVLGDEISS